MKWRVFKGIVDTCVTGFSEHYYIVWVAGAIVDIYS